MSAVVTCRQCPVQFIAEEWRDRHEQVVHGAAALLPAPPRSGPVAFYQQTSREAYELSKPRAPQLDEVILHLLVLANHTVDELEVLTGRPHQSVSAAVSRLWHREGRIRPNGEKRMTRNGRLADVYEIYRGE